VGNIRRDDDETYGIIATRDEVEIAVDEEHGGGEKRSWVLDPV
jgi:hypothetical protein